MLRLPDPRECPGPAFVAVTPDGPVELRVDADDELIALPLEAAESVTVAWRGEG